MQEVEAKDGIAAGLAACRRVLRKHRGAARLLRSARALVHFGPWRHAARALIRILRPPIAQTSPAKPSLLPRVDPAAAAAALRADGVYVVGQLPPGVVARLRAVTDGLPLAEYAHFHEYNEEVGALVADEGVLSVLRTHLGAEPVLLECTAVVHESRAERSVRPNSQSRFHFDFAGWQSLNVFVYLTDVDEHSGAHEVATGTHRTKSVRDAVRASIDDDEALRRFAGRIRTITGPAGTLFFEDTEAFHRRGPVGRRRVMLNILFASHRGLFSRGRLTRTYARYLQPAR